jgi:hypothetical protein
MGTISMEASNEVKPVYLMQMRPSGYLGKCKEENHLVGGCNPKCESNAPCPASRY